jgi:5-histidylcysteine sulfoxide synthase
MIFYYGHPAALYVNKLRVAGLVKKGINPYFESVFETGVDEMSWDDMSKNHMAWPSLHEVREFRKAVYNLVSAVISGLSDEELSRGPVSMKSPLWALFMAFEHERIHLETSSVLISEMPTSHLEKTPVSFPPVHTPSIPVNEVVNPVLGTDYPENNLISVNARKVTLGKPRDYPSYGWDNEYGSRTYNIDTFEAFQYQVSNGEFLEFVKDNGYANCTFWTDLGWGWRTFRNAKWPHFWVSAGPQGMHHYKLRNMFEVVSMPWSWPVMVNFHEAEAFAKWKSIKSEQSDAQYRVISELEHHAISDVDNIRGGNKLLHWSNNYVFNVILCGTLFAYS